MCIFEGKLEESGFVSMIVFSSIKVISVTLNSSYAIYGPAKNLTDLSFLLSLHPSLPFLQLLPI